jgi:uncharacterized protein (DUF983 family)
MTVVPEKEFYEHKVNPPPTVDCEECGEEMETPDPDDLNADMEEPFWSKKEVGTYLGGNHNKMKSYCDHCFQTKILSQVSFEETE